MAAAQDAAQSLALVDDLPELRIEIGQHERPDQTPNERRRHALRLCEVTDAAAICRRGGSLSLEITAGGRQTSRRSVRPAGGLAALRTIGSTTKAVLPIWMPKGSFAARRAADEQLRQCVVKTGEDRSMR